MKNIKIISIILILLVGLVSINQIRNVKADSGWDTSYDGGGSSSSGSSYSSSSHSSSSYSHGSHSSSGGSSSPLGTYIIFTIMCILTAYPICIMFNIKHPFLIPLGIWIVASIILGINTMGTVGFITYFAEILFMIFGGFLLPKRPNTNFPKKNYSDITEEELNKYINKSLKEVKEELFNKFVDIQESWMNFDYNKLQELCNNEIYNTYHEELEALKLKNGKNIMSNFDIVEQKITHISKKDNKTIITYYLDVKFIDYVINTKTNKVIHGVKRFKVRNQYNLKFIVSSNTNDTCPNCGGKIKTGTTTCEHCKAVIVQDSNSFVMTEKRRVN